MTKDITQHFAHLDRLITLIPNDSLKREYVYLSNYFKFTISELEEQGVDYHEQKLFNEINDNTVKCMDEVSATFNKGLAWTQAQFPEMFRKVYGI
jgi:hypothetical protein